MKEDISLNEIYDVMLEVLESKKEFIFRPRGNSMRPLIKNGKTPVVLKKAEDSLKMGDVVLCRRQKGSYVFHRVAGFTADGGYILCGDNELIRERGFYDENVLGVMTAYYRGKRRISVSSSEYRFYVNVTLKAWKLMKRALRKLKMIF